MTSIDTPLGRYVAVTGDRGLRYLQPEGSPGLPRSFAGTQSASSVRGLVRAVAALEAYFEGRCAVLDALELDPSGSEFQLRVWRGLRAIPAGATVGYGALARRIGHPGAARAIGGANHVNPIAIAIPCHRVIGADGRLVGYRGGLERKQWLLAHEAAHGVGQAASSKSKGDGAIRLSRAVARSRDRAAASI